MSLMFPDAFKPGAITFNPNVSDYTNSYVDKVKSAMGNAAFAPPPEETAGSAVKVETPEDVAKSDSEAFLGQMFEFMREQDDPERYRQRLAIKREFDQGQAKDALLVDQIKNLPKEIFKTMAVPAAMAIQGTSDIANIVGNTRIATPSLGGSTISPTQRYF